MPPSAGAYCNPPSPSLWLYAAFGSLDAEGLLFLRMEQEDKVSVTGQYSEARLKQIIKCIQSQMSFGRLHFSSGNSDKGCGKLHTFKSN